MDDIRIDKFLWAVRLFKTRSIATEACKKGKVLLNGEKVKASRSIMLNDVITINRAPVDYTYKVVGMLKNRVGAKLVAEYITDITPQSELDKLEEIKMSKVDYYRPKGTGRPTKRDRRLLDEIWE
jgi:ribosome-associated heat shock protein Hsp15